MLYVVSTPIGNLEDISLRAMRVLIKADFIACEDTRHTKKLISFIVEQVGVVIDNKKLISFHSHSGEAKVGKILDFLKKGKSVALVSDSGTPGISDPAYKITSVARENGIQISPIPGSSAFLAALQASGCSINKFEYLGYIPSKKGRETFIKDIQNANKTVVFYESVHRIQKCLDQMDKILGGQKRVIIARELTKMYEEFFDGTISEAINHFHEPKGEFVVVVPM